MASLLAELADLVVVVLLSALPWWVQGLLWLAGFA